MLNVSSLSWHYRVRAQCFSKPPTNLCRYFWSVVGSILLTGILAVARLVLWATTTEGGRPRRALPYLATALMILMMASLLGVLLYSIITDPLNFLIGLAGVVGIILGIVALVVVIMLVIAGLEELSKRHPQVQPEADKEPKPHKPKGDSFSTLFWAFIKAKKQKVCPLITVDGGVANSKITVYHDVTDE